MTPGLILFAPSFLSIKVKEQIFNFYHAETSFSQLFLGWLGLKLLDFFLVYQLSRKQERNMDILLVTKRMPQISLSQTPHAKYI